MQSLAASTLAGCAVKSMGIGLITQSGPRSIPAGGGGGGTDFTAFYAGTFETGTVGNNANVEYSGYSGTGFPIKYSNDVTGPKGETKVGKVPLPTTTGDNLYGGFLNTASPIPSAIGNEMWLRAFIMFPTSYCAGMGDHLDPWTGAIKFWRARFDTNYRLTYMLGRQDNGSGELAHNACGNVANVPVQGMINSEVSNANQYATTFPVLTRDVWHCLQWYIKFNTSGGIMRTWVNNTPVISMTTATRPVGGSTYDQLNDGMALPGDYYNGAPISNGQTLCYVANILMATHLSPPTTTDTNGNKYIPSSADARDYI